MKLAFYFLLIFSSFIPSAQGDVKIQFTGVKIFVTDLKKAEDFYQNTLGFKVVSSSEIEIELQTNQWPIILALAKETSAPGYPNNARTGLSLQTYKLLPRIDEFRKKGVKLYDSLLSRNGVGISIPFEDPFGNVMTIIEVQIREVEKFDGVRIYNSGVTIANMDAATGFYEGLLGYQEWSRNYLPDALPLKHSDGSFAFMIHYKEGLKSNPTIHRKNSQIVLMMSASNLSRVSFILQNKGIKFETEENRLVVKDPEGNHIEIKESSTP